MTDDIQLSYRVRRRKQITPTQLQAREQFSRAVAKARNQHHYSLADLANWCDVTRQGVWEWEHGCWPSDEKLSILAERLHLSYNELLTLKETT